MFEKIKKVLFKNKRKNNEQQINVEQEIIEQTIEVGECNFYTGEDAPFIYTKEGEKLYVGQRDEPTIEHSKRRR